jgi:hypothetical protein
LKRLIMAALLPIGMTAATAASAGASAFDKNDNQGPNGQVSHAGKSPDCQPGKGKGDTVQHTHVGPPGQTGVTPGQIHGPKNGAEFDFPGCQAPTPPKPPTPPPKPPTPPTPVHPVVPGHGAVSPTAAVSPQHVAVVTPQHVSQQQAVQQQVTVAPAAAPVQTTAHFTG